MLRDIISITSACLLLVASYFLIKDILKLSPKIIVNISINEPKTRESLSSELSKQNANNKVGFVLLIISFVCQLIVLSSFPTIQQMKPPSKIAIIISIIIGILFFVLSSFASNYIHKQTLKKIVEIRNSNSNKTSKTINNQEEL